MCPKWRRMTLSYIEYLVSLSPKCKTSIELGRTRLVQLTGKLEGVNEQTALNDNPSENRHRSFLRMSSQVLAVGPTRTCCEIWCMQMSQKVSWTWPIRHLFRNRNTVEPVIYETLILLSKLFLDTWQAGDQKNAKTSAGKEIWRHYNFCTPCTRPDMLAKMSGPLPSKTYIQRLWQQNKTLWPKHLPLFQAKPVAPVGPGVQLVQWSRKSAFVIRSIAGESSDCFKFRQRNARGTKLHLVLYLFKTSHESSVNTICNTPIDRWNMPTLLVPTLLPMAHRGTEVQIKPIVSVRHAIARHGHDCKTPHSKVGTLASDETPTR